jgi:hypothetical protein
VDTTGTPEDGGVQSWGPGEPASDEYGYDTGYDYGPGYSDPGGGYGHGYGSPAPSAERDATPLSGQQATAPFGATAAGPPPLPPVVGPTPALRGLPGGPGIEPVADESAPPRPAGDPLRQTRQTGQAGGSLWQQSQSIWSDCGIVWQRPAANWEPAEAEWERIQSASARSGRRRGKGDGGRDGRRVAASARAAARAPTAIGPGATGGPVATGGAAAIAGPAAKGRGAGLAGRRRSKGGAIIVGAAVILAVALLAAVGYVISGATGGGHKTPAPKHRRPLPVSPYPPAALAGADFTSPPALATRAVFQSLSAVASHGSTVVAAGSETGTDMARTQFFVSTDGGRTWRLAPVFTANGSEPPATHPPTAIVVGTAGWLAISPGASWTSSTGRSWQLTATPGIPLESGDRVLALTATARGFLAAGSGAQHGLGVPVVWTSPDGRRWQRAAAQLPLRTPGGAVGAIVGAAAHGGNTVAAAQVTTTVRTGAGQPKRIQRNTSVGLWQSQDGGVTWSQAPVPVSNGAGNAVSGIASSGGGFVLVRPGATVAAGPEGVIYTSTTGRTWTYAGTITPGKKAALRLLMVRGSDQGAVIGATTAGGNLVAYRNVSGQPWRQAAILANTRDTSLSGLTMLPGGSVLAAGAAAVPGGSRGFLAVAAASRTVVDLAKIPGAWFPQRSVNAIASTPGLNVAVGSAGGQPAVWTAPPGHAWSPAAAVNPTVFGRTGLTALNSITVGSSGWLAVGGPAGGAPHPVIVFSSDGRTWRAADGAAAFGRPGAIASASAAHGSRYVVVGARTMGGRTVAAAWWSSGLGSWNRAAAAGKDALTGRTGTRRMVAVTAGSFGFVAVGQRDGLPAAWTSTDGGAWRLVSLPAVSGGGNLSYVTSSGNTVVAAGTVPRPTGSVPLVAVSPDGGLTWREITVAAPAGFTRLTGLTSTGSSFVAVGTVGSPGQSDVVVLTSADAATWKLVVPSGTGLSGPGEQQITALTTAGGQLLGAGFTATARSEDPTLWIAPPAPATTTGTATTKAAP